MITYDVMMIYSNVPAYVLPSYHSNNGGRHKRETFVLNGCIFSVIMKTS